MTRVTAVSRPIERPEEAPAVALRPPETVMRLERLGSGFQTRLSFMRSLIRRMHREGWRVERTRFDLDDQGYGTVVYAAVTPTRRYSLVGFSHHLDPERRTDRVIAEDWDTTFALFDGDPGEADIARLRAETPRQEAGRFRASELVLSRANRSVRLFEHVVERLSGGRQPDPAVLAGVGYLMRTTAVYGNGKFGLGDRARYLDRPELAGPFRAELLTVYLIRCFTLDLIEHVARRRDPERFVPLDRRLKRFLGIGNATGLGMAPFLVSHPVLIHNWYRAREEALARVRARDPVTAEELARFRRVLGRARAHVAEWRVGDPVQSARIDRLGSDLDALTAWTEEPRLLSEARPWDRLFRRAEAALSLEAQELLVSLLLEPYPDLVDPLGEGLEAEDDAPLDPALTVGGLDALVRRHYRWALDIDFSRPEALRHFWYYSEEKLEPRRGLRDSEPGAEKEMPLAVARDLQALAAGLEQAEAGETLAAFLLRRPDLRHIARRVQLCARHPYAEIHDNLMDAACRPIDILRGKLAYFGASKFDPKSDLWTRITLYQGAPLPDELARADADDWCFPVTPAPPPCTSP